MPHDIKVIQIAPTTTLEVDGSGRLHITITHGNHVSAVAINCNEVLKAILKLMQPGTAYAALAAPAPGEPIIPTYEDLPFAKCLLCGGDYITSPTLQRCPHCFPSK